MHFDCVHLSFTENNKMSVSALVCYFPVLPLTVSSLYSMLYSFCRSNISLIVFTCVSFCRVAMYKYIIYMHLSLLPSFFFHCMCLPWCAECLTFLLVSEMFFLLLPNLEFIVQLSVLTLVLQKYMS